jgi:hypothetical protein
MQPIACSALSAVVLLAAAGVSQAKEFQGKDGPVQLKLESKKASYTWDGGGLKPAEYRKMLDQIAEEMKKKGAGLGMKVPPAPAVDLVVKLVNTSKDDITIYVGGDPNVMTFELKGPGVVTLPNPVAFTADFKLPKAHTLKAGESFDIPVARLMDGLRGAARLLYWTEPGEYTLSVTYKLSDQQGSQTHLLKSEPIRLKVEMPK